MIGWFSGGKREITERAAHMWVSPSCHLHPPRYLNDSFETAIARDDLNYAEDPSSVPQFPTGAPQDLARILVAQRIARLDGPLDAMAVMSFHHFSRGQSC